MIKDSVDLLELLRKRGLDGDVDFLREALRVLVVGIKEASRPEAAIILSFHLTTTDL